MTLINIILGLIAVIGVATLVWLVLNIYHAIKHDKHYYDEIALFKAQQALLAEKPRDSNLVPLTWNKENGFNRAPTLVEAMQFRVDDNGDYVREHVAEHGNLPEN